MFLGHFISNNENTLICQTHDDPQLPKDCVTDSLTTNSNDVIIENSNCNTSFDLFSQMKPNDLNITIVEDILITTPGRTGQTNLYSFNDMEVLDNASMNIIEAEVTLNDFLVNIKTPTKKRYKKNKNDFVCGKLKRMAVS